MKQRTAGSTRRPALLILALGLSIRALLLTRLPHDVVMPHTRWELNAIATSLLERGAFADPYLIPTGPTAHLPPVSPAITAAIWALFGGGLRAGYAGWMFHLATSAVLYALLPWFAVRVGLGRPAGILAGVAGACWVTFSVHGEGLAGIALVLMLAAFHRRWTAGAVHAWSSLALGLGAGISFHVQPALMPVVAGCLGYELARGRRNTRGEAGRAAAPPSRAGLHAGLVAAAALVACLPWGWRNHVRLGDVFFIRDNLGLELRMGNHEGAVASIDVMGRHEEYRHPRTHRAEALLVAELGEAEYMRRAGGEARAWIASHPARFARLTIERFALFWLGPLHAPRMAWATVLLAALAAWGAARSFGRLAAPSRAVLVLPLLTFPLVYYVVGYLPRYREPLDWLLLLLAAACLAGVRPATRFALDARRPSR